MIQHILSYLISRNMTSPFNEFKDRWKHIKLRDSDVYLYSAYYDDRKRTKSAKEGDDPVVRLNVLATKEFKTRNRNTLCLVKLKSGRVFTVRIAVIILLEHFNLKWTSYFVNCKLTQIITGKLHDPNTTIKENVSFYLKKADISSVSLVDKENLDDVSKVFKSELQVQKFIHYTE